MLFIRIKPFFIVYGYNIPLLNYNISITAGTRDRDVRILIETKNKILKKLWEIFNFA